MKRKNLAFYCFSPPVMLATFIIEAGLLVYTLLRYRLSMVVGLSALMLGFLAVFQLAEYFVCGGVGLDAKMWSRIGYAAITMLPALGLHLLHALAGQKKSYLVNLAYASAAGFIVFFLLDTAVFDSHECTGNYVIFRIGDWPAVVYGLYYYGWLLVSLVKGVKWSAKLRASKSKFGVSRANALLGLVAGYLVFLVPTAIANTVKPETRAGIPSIMCGFAVLFALVLVFYILPKYRVDKKKT